jgi:prefoldin subunit 5
MNTCFLETIASSWLYILGLIKRVDADVDAVSTAKESIQIALSTLQEQHTRVNNELGVTVNVIKTRNQNMPKPELKHLLMKSRRIRNSVMDLEKKRNLLENQLNAIETNECNKVVIQGLQSSADALKKMGLQSDLHATDQAISDLEQGIGHAQDISTTLAMPINIGEFDESELDNELDIIMGIGTVPTSHEIKTDVCVDIPKTQNSIHKEKPVIGMENDKDSVPQTETNSIRAEAMA